jgi:hypothetical protein
MRNISLFVPREKRRIFLRPLTALVSLACCVAFLFSGCSSSRLASVWMDPAYNLGPMKSMMVISMSKNPLRRRLWEDNFITELRKYGVDAIPSYSLFPGNLPDTNQINNMIRKHNNDGLLLISRLPTQIQYKTSSAYVSQTPVTAYNHWRKKYVTRLEEVYHPEQVDSVKIVRYEVDIWAARESSHLVWSGICTITQPVSSKQVHDETVGLIGPKLSKSGILPLKQ